LTGFLGTEFQRTRQSKQVPDGSSTIEAFAEIHFAFAKFSEKLAGGNLSITKAELIQHSSERASPLVLALAKGNADIDLLLQDFKTAEVLSPPLYVSGIRKRFEGYQQLLERINYRKEFKLYLYKTPASVDGVRLKTPNGEVILILGWYGYYHKGIMADLGPSKVGGAENPCIVINSAHRDFKHFDEFFEDLLINYKSQTEAPALHMGRGRLYS
jgi:hypothetical protein